MGKCSWSLFSVPLLSLASTLLGVHSSAVRNNAIDRGCSAGPLACSRSAPSCRADATYNRAKAWPSRHAP